MPEVEAPEGSDFDCRVVVGSANFGLVPEVDGVGDECGLLMAGEPLESGLGGETGGSAGAGGAAWRSSVGWINWCVGWIQMLQLRNCGPVVLKFWHSVFFSSQKSVDVCSFESCPQLFFLRC